MDDLLKLATKLGLKIERRKRHWRVFNDKGSTTISCTPSDRRAWLNARAKLRKLI